jgi:steroid delta-isomerase-like uncharacterized protein
MPGAETEIYTIARRWVECGWQKGQSEVVDELHAPNFVDHNPAGRGSDNHGFKEGIVQLYAAFPDFYARIEDILIDAAQSKATVRWTATGTHRGTFMGCDPTGRIIRFKCIEIIRIDNGRIAERWGEWNPVELLEQLRSEKRRPQPGLTQKEDLAWVRANRTPRPPTTQICAGFWLTVRARLSRRAGVKPRPTFFLQQARERNTCATRASTMKISENPMESEFVS